MKRKELDALKGKLLEQKGKALDLEVLAGKLFGLLGGISNLLPDEVKAIIDKYQKSKTLGRRRAQKRGNNPW